MSIEIKKWYSKKWLVVLLLFIIPPVAVYGVFRRDSKIWKKVLFTLGGLFSSLFLTLFVYGLFNMPSDYEIAEDFRESGEYRKAIDYYSGVEVDNQNYNKAQLSIREIEFKLDSISLSIKAVAKKQRLDSLAKIEAVKLFNIGYAKSVLKEWNDTYVKSYDISENNDSIVFNMSARSTEGNWSSGAKLNERIYQKRYDSIFKLKFVKDSITAKIVYSPNLEQLNKNEIINRRNHLVNRQFGTFNGSNAFLVNFIKDRMNNPKSFKHIETSYKDKGSYIDVYMSFRGTNSYGALVMYNIKAKMSINGEVLSAKYL